MVRLCESNDMDGNAVENFNLFMNFGFPLLLLVLAYFTGSMIERRNFRDIRRREEDYAGFPVVSFDTRPADWNVSGSAMVTGSIVVSLDIDNNVWDGIVPYITNNFKCTQSKVVPNKLH